MSHYTCLVVGDNPEDQLIPFQENNMGTCPKEYLEFKDIEDESRKDYEKDTTNCFVSPTGEIRSMFDEEFRNPEYEVFSIDNKVEKYIPPAGWHHEDVPVKTLYPTFEEYMENYCGNKKDEVLGRYGYWENPNAKWDWYQLGGRWGGFFTNKDGEEVDTELIENIDFKTKWAENYKLAVRVFNHVQKFIKGTPTLTPWNEIREEEKEKGEDGHIERAREIYRVQPRAKALEEMQTEMRNNRERYSEEMHNHVGWLSDYEDFNKDRETYAKDYADNCQKTFAVLMDGRWHERGKMGWWACVSDEKDRETWSSIWDNIINKLPKDTRLSVYDCHI